MRIKRFERDKLSERGSAVLYVDVTVDIEGLWTLEELNRLLHRMTEIEKKISEEVAKMEEATAT